jgi:glycosyltransferase involved in cell wall biosynthesis
VSQRLLYVVNIPRFFVSHRLPLALAAQRAGYEVHVATADTDEENLAVIRRHGLLLHAIPLEQHGTVPVRELRTLVALVRLFQRLRPDLIHLVTIKPLLYGGIAARLTRRRAVVAAMSGLGRVFRDEAGGARTPSCALVFALRAALPATSSHLLLQNEDDRDVLVSLGVVDRASTSVIPGSGVDLDRFRPSPRPTAGPHPVVFLYAGRLMRQKGLDDFVAVARRRRGQMRFVVAGYSEEGSPDAVPVAQLEDWAEEGLIEWLGARRDMPAVIAASDVVVLPTAYGEGVPKVLIEAAASGRAIVTTDTPGCRDICRDGINGLLVPPGDVEALEQAVHKLAEDRELRERMGAAGRSIAEEGFGLDRILAASLGLYATVLGRTR